MAEHQIAIEEARDNLLACAARLAESIKNSDGRSEAMKEIVPRYLEKGAVDLSAELADTVDDPFTRDRLLMLVAERCAAIDDDDYAFQLVEAIEDYGTQAQAREHIALQKSAKGDYAKALEIARALDHADYAYADIAVRQIENGDEVGGFQTLDKIEFPNAKVAALQNIALRELKKGDAAKAIQSFENAVQSAVEIEFAEEKVRALTDIGNHYVEANQNGLAIEIFDRAKAAAETIDGVHRDSLLGAIALGFLRAGSLELADRTLDSVTDKTQMASALVGFSQKFSEDGEPDEAVETLEEAYQILKSQRDREIRDSRARYNLWATIAVEFARIEKAERAVEIAQEILDETAQTAALKQIAQVCTLQNRDDLARQAVGAIGDDAQRMFALIGTSDAQNKLNKTDEALRVLREAETLCETVPQLASRSAAYNELAKRFYAFGDAEKARELVRENLENISGIRDESVRVAALAELSDLHDELKFELNAAEKEILETLARKAER
jgi:tetratricopeptide (TPR) repeat protein